MLMCSNDTFPQLGEEKDDVYQHDGATTLYELLYMKGHHTGRSCPNFTSLWI
jgi:hypothetical protein